MLVRIIVIRLPIPPSFADATFSPLGLYMLASAFLLPIVFELFSSSSIKLPKRLAGCVPFLRSYIMYKLHFYLFQNTIPLECFLTICYKLTTVREFLSTKVFS